MSEVDGFMDMSAEPTFRDILVQNHGISSSRILKPLGNTVKHR